LYNLYPKFFQSFGMLNSEQESACRKFFVVTKGGGDLTLSFVLYE
jgi:hypothetical protein